VGRLTFDDRKLISNLLTHALIFHKVV